MKLVNCLFEIPRSLLNSKSDSHELVLPISKFESRSISQTKQRFFAKKKITWMILFWVPPNGLGKKPND